MELLKFSMIQANISRRTIESISKSLRLIMIKWDRISSISMCNIDTSSKSYLWVEFGLDFEIYGKASNFFYIWTESYV